MFIYVFLICCCATILPETLRPTDVKRQEWKRLKFVQGSSMKTVAVGTLTGLLKAAAGWDDTAADNAIAACPQQHNFNTT